jgi:hypothetical protein
VTVLNALIGRAFDLLLAPVEQFPPIVGVAAVALITAVPMLLVFRAVSDQKRLAAVKRAIVGALFEVRLFNDDLPAILRAQAEILKHNLHYLRLSLVPMLWLAVPLGLALAHLEYHFAYGGPAEGQPILVKAQLRSAANTPRGASNGSASGAREQPVVLEAPESVQVLTAAIWFPTTNEVLWRVSGARSGEYELRIHVGDETLTKTLRVGDGIGRRSPVREEPGFLSQLTNPAEPPLPAGSALASVSVAYEPEAIRIWGWNLPWMVVYFALTILFAVPLRRPLKVTI